MSDLSKVPLDKDVQENTGTFTVLPAGNYKVVIIGDELKTNRSNTGMLLELKLQVTHGQFKGHELVDRLNLTNPNSTAQAIGQGTLKRICNLTKVAYPPADTRRSWGVPIVAKIGVESFTSNTTGKELQSNKVERYSAIESGSDFLHSEAPPPVNEATDEVPW